MFDMYHGFACYKNWDFEVYNYTPAEYGKFFCLCVHFSEQRHFNKVEINVSVSSVWSERVVDLLFIAC